MIVNRFDYHAVNGGPAFGVGYDILNSSAFDPSGVALYNRILNLRREYHGDGVFAVDCGANIGTFTIEWAKAMTGWGSVLPIEARNGFIMLWRGTSRSIIV